MKKYTVFSNNLYNYLLSYIIYFHKYNSKFNFFEKTYYKMKSDNKNI